MGEFKKVDLSRSGGDGKGVDLERRWTQERACGIRDEVETRQSSLREEVVSGALIEAELRAGNRLQGALIPNVLSKRSP